MSFKIVDDMPLPQAKGGSKAGRDKYGISKLEVGQALIFDADDADFVTRPNGERSHNAYAAARYRQRNGKGKFASRFLPDGRFGIWRTE